MKGPYEKGVAIHSASSLSLGKRPLMPVEAVTPVRGPHGIRGLVLQERRRQVLIQRQEQARG